MTIGIIRAECVGEECNNTLRAKRSKTRGSVRRMLKNSIKPTLVFKTPLANGNVAYVCSDCLNEYASQDIRNCLKTYGAELK